MNAVTDYAALASQETIRYNTEYLACVGKLNGGQFNLPNGIMNIINKEKS